MDKRDSDKMIQLAREGKEISKIWEEDFPQYDYWDIYIEVYGAGERSAVGIRRMITNKLNKLTSLSYNEQAISIKEIDDLIWHLYNRYRENQQKLNDIRNIISK